MAAFLPFLTNCKEREITNPFDPDCPKEIFTPTNFKAEQSGTLVKLSWKQANVNIGGFLIKRNENDGPYAEAAWLTKYDTIWNDNIAVGEKKYGYQLYAFAGDNQSNLLTIYLNPVFGATVLTDIVSGITTNSAILGGNVINMGGSEITERGICFSSSINPTIAGSKVSMGSGTGEFTGELTGLAENTTYYIRAYAINIFATAYGSELSFKTNIVLSLPGILTSIPASITSTTAILGGSITSDGNAAVTERGIFFSTLPNTVVTGTKRSIGSGTGVFSESMTGLTPGTSYYFKAYALNSVGTAYGEEINFTTGLTIPTLSTLAATSITQTTASSGGIIISDGGANITNRGICWSTRTNPSISDSKSSDGEGSGSYISSMSDLTANTIYYVRSFATNEIGTGYGPEVNFKTIPNLPTIITTNITGITQNSASTGGTVTSDGGSSVTGRGVCWSTNSNPTTLDSKTNDGIGIGMFTSNLSGLNANTTYFVRSYAVNSTGTNYGNEISFKTSALLPTIITTEISGITLISATTGGNVSNDGGASITSRGVCWSTASNPTINGSKTSDGTGTGTFTSEISGLTANTLYYVRAYAVNSSGPAYGNQISFKTNSETNGTFTDSRDNNAYKWIKLDTKIWMAENLAYLPSVNPSNMYSTSVKYYYVYDYEGTIVSEAKLLSKYKTYGVLYNWSSAKTACPTGWHLPSDAEWTILEEFLGAPVGGKMKETGTMHWLSPNTGATNSSGFNALPGGYFGDYGIGYRSISSTTGFWTSTEKPYSGPWCRFLDFNSDVLSRSSKSAGSGYSVRCVKD